MKKSLYLSFIWGIFIFPLSALAISPPEINKIPDAVDAPTYTISGTTEPAAKITVIGEANEIPPVTANNTGKFQITVGLNQETINQFLITVAKNNEVSSAVTVTIKEGVEAAIEYQNETGEDVVAPSSPIIEIPPKSINTDIIEINGKAEVETTIHVRNRDGSEIVNTPTDSVGNFSICVPLAQNKQNSLSFIVQDTAGNTSTIKQIIISENSDDEEVLYNNCVTEEPAQNEETPNTPNNEELNHPFNDIINHWAETFITQLYQKKIVKGKTSDTFAPDTNITRSELTKIALLAFEYNIPTNITKKPFADTDLEAWYTPFINKAKGLDAIQGYADGTFGPNKSVSRAEALKILLTLSKLPLSQGTPNFSDTPASAWYKYFVAFAQENNIIGGYSDNTFRPNAPITRAEVAKITLKIIEVKGVNEKPDEEHNPASETPVLPENLQLYTNAFHKFRFQFNKNWFYEWIGTEESTIANIRLSKMDPRDEEFSSENILVEVKLLKQPLSKTGKENNYNEITGDKLSIYKEYDQNSHFQIIGNYELKNDIETIAETLEINIKIEE